MPGRDHFGDPRDTRWIGARMIKEHTVADLHLVAEKVPRLVIPHAIPPVVRSGSATEVGERIGARFRLEQPVGHGCLKSLWHDLGPA